MRSFDLHALYEALRRAYDITSLIVSKIAPYLAIKMFLDQYRKTEAPRPVERAPISVSHFLTDIGMSFGDSVSATVTRREAIADAGTNSFGLSAA